MLLNCNQNILPFALTLYSLTISFLMKIVRVTKIYNFN